jgi:chorismate dehydratase
VSKPKRLGVSPHTYCLPLTEGLQKDAAFELCVDATTKNAIRLRHRDLDAAFLSPIDYARESSDYFIVPAIAVSSRQGNDTVVLHFRENLHAITTLAADPSSTSEIILAKILLAEKFDSEPSIVPVTGTLNTMLSKADAALLVGDAAFDVATSHFNKLDLIEEWNDLLNLPYVHGFWCGRENAVTQPEIERIQQARDNGVCALDRLSSESVPRFHSHVTQSTLKTYLDGFTYDFTDEVREGLNEFLRYAYYHRVLPDVAEINFYGASSDSSGDSAEISLN